MFIFRYHIDPVPGPQKPLVSGAFRALECSFALVSGMHGMDERVCFVRKHFYGQTLRKSLGRILKVSDNHVDPPPPHHVGGVWVHLIHE